EGAIVGGGTAGLREAGVGVHVDGAVVDQVAADAARAAGAALDVNGAGVGQRAVVADGQAGALIVGHAAHDQGDSASVSERPRRRQRRVDIHPVVRVAV